MPRDGATAPLRHPELLFSSKVNEVRILEVFALVWCCLTVWNLRKVRWTSDWCNQKKYQLLLNFKKCVSLSIRVYPGPFLQGRTRYDFKQHPGSSLFVIEAPWLLWHLANISQADQIPRRCQQPSGIRIYINLKQTQNNARLLNITEMYIICIHMYIHYTWTYRFISQLISQNHTLNMNDNMMFIQIPNITSVISYDSCCSPKVNKNPGVSTTPEVKATDKFGESKSQAIRWNRCDRHRRNWRAPGKVHKDQQTSEPLNSNQWDLKLIWYQCQYHYKYTCLYIIYNYLLCNI